MKLLPFYASIFTYVFSYVICKIIGNFLGSDGFEFFWVFPPTAIQLLFYLLRTKIKKLNFFAMFTQTIYAIFFIFYMIPDIYKLEAYLAFYISVLLLSVTILRPKEFIIISFTGIFFFFGLYIYNDGILTKDEGRIVFILLSFSFFSFLSSGYVNWIRKQLKKKEATLLDNFELMTNQKEKVDNILNNLNQGYLTFDRNGNIGDEVTVITSTLLEYDFINSRNKNNKIWDVIYKNKDDKNKFKRWIDKVFEGRLSFIDLIPLSPKFYIGEEKKYVKLEFRPIFKKGSKRQVEKIIMIASDKTKEILLESKADKEKEHVDFIINGLQYPIDFLDLIHDTYEVLEKELDIKNQKEILFRQYHTLKARFGQFKLKSLVRLIDNIETQIQNREEEFLKEGVKKFKDEFYDLLKDNNLIVKAVNKMLVEEGNAIEARRVIEYIVMADSLEELHLLIYEDHILVDLKGKLSKYVELIKQIAIQQDKNVDFKISGDEVLVEYNKYSPFVNSLIHIFRNMVDHGIEPLDERAEKSKPEKALISVKFKKDKDHFIITFEDDGRGLDPEKIKSTVINQGLKTSEEVNKLERDEIINLIFLQGFSTKEGTTEFSGRGVGMDAVKSEVNNLSGTILAESETGKKTKFLVKLPL